MLLWFIVVLFVIVLVIAALWICGYSSRKKGQSEGTPYAKAISLYSSMSMSEKISTYDRMLKNDFETFSVEDFEPEDIVQYELFLLLQKDFGAN